MSDSLELKKFHSRQDIVTAYSFPNGRNDEIGTCWFMLPLEHQLSNFNRGLGRISYYKTIKRDLETTPYVEKFESPENRKEIMYEMITDYILLLDFVHPEDCDCGTCEPKDRAALLKLDGFDDCYLGVGESYAENPALIYDYEKIIEKLKQDGMSDEEAREYYEFNILGSYIGEKMPIFLNRIPLDDLGDS
jgi:hypothetical protein